MRKSVLTEKSRFFLRGVALLVVAGFGAGCSADMSRFTYKDFTTGSVNQQQVIRKTPVAQPFPENGIAQESTDYSDAGNDPAAAPAIPGSVTRRALSPVSAARQTVTPVQLASAEDGEPSLAPVTSASKKLKTKAGQDLQVIDETATGAVKPAVRKIDLTAKKIKPLSLEEEGAAQPKLKRVPAVSDAAPVKANKTAAEHGGWTSEGGTVITVREGETVYNFSKRFGVPVDSLLKANGLSDASQVHAGQQLIVPAYRYSKASGVSAPDANFETAAAKSTSGTIYDVPQNHVPVPGKVPSRENVAVLPSVPQLKEKAASTTLAVVEPKATAKSDRLKGDPETAAAGKAGGAYEVASGDSLYKIAKSHGVSVAALKEANGISDGKLRIGQALKIPAQGGKGPLVAKSADVDMIQTSAAAQNAKVLKPTVIADGKVKEYTAPKTDEVKAEADQDDSAAPNATGISKLRWPVRGRTVTAYGQRDGGVVNDGIDISVPEGTPIKAAENGVVIYAGSGLKEFGNTVLVRHADGLVTVYGHASEMKVKRGQTIKRGQEIATAGRTGNATAPKLHFEVRKNSAPVDPSGYLE